MNANLKTLVTSLFKTHEAKTIVLGVQEANAWRDGAFDAIVWMLMLENPTFTKSEAETWLVEELHEMKYRNV